MTTISPKVGYVRVFNWSDNIFGRPFVPFGIGHHVLLHEGTDSFFFFGTRNKKDTFDCKYGY